MTTLAYADDYQKCIQMVNTGGRFFLKNNCSEPLAIRMCVKNQEDVFPCKDVQNRSFTELRVSEVSAPLEVSKGFGVPYKGGGFVSWVACPGGTYPNRWDGEKGSEYICQ